MRNLKLATAAALAAMLWAAPATATQGVTDTEIVIGSHQPLSGPAAPLGIPAANGMRLRVDEVNAAGGIHGRKIRVIIEDTGYQQDKAAQAADKLLERDKIFAMVGALGTPMNMVVLPRQLEKGVPNLFPLSAAVEMYEPLHKYKFSLALPYHYQARALVSYLAKTKGYKKFASLYQDDDFGLNVVKGVRDQVKDMRLELVSETTYKRGAREFSSQIAQMKAAGAQAVILGTVIAETIGAKVEARKAGWNVDMGVTTAGYASETAELAKGATDGLYGIGQAEIPYEDAATGEVKKWVERYKAKFNITPSIFALLGYGAMDIAVEGLKRAGKELTSDSLSKALEGIKNYKSFVNDAPINLSATSHLGVPEREGMILSQVKGTRWHRIQVVGY
jgi:ABC-type branched-subunit amino acid transport system substrate-binding protein